MLFAKASQSRKLAMPSKAGCLGKTVKTKSLKLRQVRLSKRARLLGKALEKAIIKAF